MTNPKITDWIKGVREKAEKAHKEIGQLALGERFRMCIPAQEYDSDMTLQAPLDDLPLALDMLDEALKALEWYQGNFNGKDGSKWRDDTFFYEDKFGGSGSALGKKQAVDSLSRIQSLLDAKAGRE
jgi:hypothetical protein